MKSRRHSAISSGVVQQNAPIFSGILIQWHNLTQSEKVVCSCIVLIPLWWLWGWSYLAVFLAISVFAYQYFHKGSLHLQKPSLFVIAGIAYGLYELLSMSFWAIYNNYSLNPRSFTNSITTWIAPLFLLWYIKNHKIKVRPQVIAWAFSIVVFQMLLFWVVIHFLWKENFFIPPRSLFGLLTGKGEVFVPGVGNSNFLMPYFPSDSSLLGMVRYVFFFHGPESLALVVGFVCILAVDIQQKIWSIILFSGSFFLLLLSGTRSTWLAIPAVLIIRWLLAISKNGKLWRMFVLLAIVSFVTLSIPTVTDLFSNSATHTAKATGEFRGDSTEVRAEIYRRTWEGFINGSDTQLIFGHIVSGETVLPGYAPATVGSHSFLLSTLLYRKGLLGAAIFLSFWTSLISWLYATRKSRPMSCLIVYILFSLTFSVMEWESVVMPLILITSVTHHPTLQMPKTKHDFKALSLKSRI
jgi:O-Antigen ligase